MEKITKLNATTEAQPRSRVTVRKIGKTTFIVSSRFSEKKRRDPAAVIARLIQYDTDQAGNMRK